ncbi:hypothetical protein [Desulfobulbus oligotrophicus]|uniref:Uncharacterized protein n=1 Tax=Desulfobulbus oligotrophicus TaxID=1909699 RepID=A0A7T5VEV1_9BACT|nr:hypothetical protein [Desulfobulbus oligotrophicus]QQG66474.1 hypothetical protein HP555_11660 [Desulfobulbus oligotrophicus]
MTRQELEKGMSSLKIIWSALAMSLIMYVLAVPLILDRETVNLAAETYAELRLFMYPLAGVTLVASWFVRRSILAAKPSATRNRSRQHPAIQRYTTAMIVTLAMTQSIGLYGLILYLLGSNRVDLYLLTALAAVAMILYFPRQDEVMQLAERFSSRSGKRS